MNRLAPSDRVRVFELIVEGVGMRAIHRLTGIGCTTQRRLIREAGIACAWLHDALVRDVATERIECDELWSFVGKRMRDLRTLDIGDTRGPIWTWIAVDADTKLVLQSYCGARTAAAADTFFHRLRERVGEDTIVSTDLNDQYRVALRQHPMLDHAAVSTHKQTNAVERVNGLVRSHLRRYTRKSNGFSKDADYHRWTLALYLFWYNFGKAARAQRRATPAQRAGILSCALSMTDVDALITAAWAREPVGTAWDVITQAMQARRPFVAQPALVVASGIAPLREQLDHPADRALA